MSNDDFVSDFDFGDDDIDRDGKGGGVAVGAYTFQVANVVTHTENSGDMMLELEVLAGTPASEVGKTHHEYIKYPKPDLGDDANGVRRSIIRQTLYAFGLTTPEELKANPRVKINWALAIGRVCKGKLADDSYQDASGSTKSKTVLFKKGHWCLWAASDPKAAGIPEPANMGGGQSNKAPDAPFGDLPV
jgi:hypothetical protein